MKLLYGTGKNFRVRELIYTAQRPSRFGLWSPLLPDFLPAPHAHPLYQPYYYTMLLIVHSVYQVVSRLCAFAQALPSAH